MSTRSSSRQSLAALIRLADNPDFGDKDDDDEKEDKADDGPPWAKDEYDDDNDKEDKGKTVTGPKTKLMLAELAAQNAELRKSQQVLAKGLSYLISNLSLADDDEDDDKDDDKEDKGRRTRPSARTLSKDDAATSFGEQDNNTPGNRPFDETDQNEDHTVIQGGPSAGPGPTGAQSPSIDPPYTQNKGSLDARIAAMVDERVNKALAASPTLMKATAPSPGGGTSTAAAAMESTENKADDLMSPFSKEARDMSFEELNRLRIMSGAISFV